MPFDVDVDVDELDDLGVGESVVHDDLVFGDFIDLDDGGSTTFTATMLPVTISRASLTCP